MHRSAEFRSSWHNEWEFAESGDPIRPGARPLAECIADAIRACGVETGSVDQHSFYGWGFRSHLRGYGFHSVLNPIDADSNFLTVSPVARLPWFFKRRQAVGAFDDFCAIVAEALQAVDGVSEVRWDAA